MMIFFPSYQRVLHFFINLEMERFGFWLNFNVPIKFFPQHRLLNVPTQKVSSCRYRLGGWHVGTPR